MNWLQRKLDLYIRRAQCRSLPAHPHPSSHCDLVPTTDQHGKSNQYILRKPIAITHTEYNHHATHYYKVEVFKNIDFSAVHPNDFAEYFIEFDAAQLREKLIFKSLIFADHMRNCDPAQVLKIGEKSIPDKFVDEIMACFEPVELGEVIE